MYENIDDDAFGARLLIGSFPWDNIYGKHAISFNGIIFNQHNLSCRNFY